MMRRSSTTPAADAQARHFVGLYVASDGRAASAALVKVVGVGLSSQVSIVAHRLVELPTSAAGLFTQLQQKNTSPGVAATLAAAWAAPQAELLHALLREVRLRTDDVEALGIVDPGLWQFGADRPVVYQSLCDAARLAELSGINCIDAFAARDIAQGGHGGPLLALPEWMLLHDPRVGRGLLHLRRSMAFTWLPGGSTAAAGDVLSFDVGPGTALLDQLTLQLTDGQQQWDPGGRMAVQGTQIAALEEHWLADPCFQRGLPRWHPHGVRPERFLAEGIRLALEHDWPLRDVLCTATHFLAETVKRAIQRHVVVQRPLDELVLCGGGQFNGLLLRELSLRLPACRLTPISKLNLNDAALRPACAALLALLFLDQVPANRSALTGADQPRVLGRLTPASPQAWRRLMERAAPARRAA